MGDSEFVTTPLTERQLFAAFIAEITAAAQFVLRNRYEDSEIDHLEELCLLVCADLRARYCASARVSAQDRAGTRPLAPVVPTSAD
jgi:hypothetical protein